MPTPSAPGINAVGSSRETRLLPLKPKAGRILDLYERSWKEKPLKCDEFVISAMKRPAFKRGGKNISRFRRPANVRCGLNISTVVVEPGPTWRPSMSRTPASSVVAKQPPALHRLTALSSKSLTRPPYNDARRVFLDRRQRQFAPWKGLRDQTQGALPTPHLSMDRSPPVGSIRLRATSPSSRERCSHRTTSPTWVNLPNVYSTSNTTGNPLPNP